MRVVVKKSNTLSPKNELDVLSLIESIVDGDLKNADTILETLVDRRIKSKINKISKNEPLI